MSTSDRLPSVHACVARALAPLLALLLVAGALLPSAPAVRASAALPAALAAAAVTPTFTSLPDLPDSVHRATSVAVGDLNGDGKLDIVLGNANGASQVFLNYGSGYFTAANLPGNAGSTQSVAVGDLNGDGALDIVLGNSGTVVNQIYLNDGHGGFPAAIALTSSGQQTTSVAVGDFDGQNGLDIVLGNAGQASQVFLKTGSGGFATPTLLGTGSNTTSVAVGDFDGQNGLDIVLGNAGQASQVFTNTGSGNFGTPAPLGTGSNTTSVAVGDFDGQNGLDIVLGNTGQASQVFTNTGSGNFGTPAPLGTGSNTTSSVTVGDLNGDGALDIVLGNNDPHAASRMFVNDGHASFSTPIDLTINGRNTKSVALGDLNGDGALDIVLGNEYAQTSQVLVNDGHASFGTAALLGTSSSTRTVAVGDFDGKTGLDIVLGNELGISQVLLNDGHGGFPAAINLPGSGRNTWSVVVGDLNGDGALDIVLGNAGQASQVFLNMNDGSGSFKAPTDLTGNGRNTYSMALGDLNDDSALDIVLGNQLGTSQVLLNDGYGGFPAAINLPGSGRNTRGMALGDLNGDGALDIVLGNQFGISQVFLNDGQASFTVADLPGGNNTTVSVALGDLDGDGALDIVLGNYGQASQVFLNGGHGSFSVSYLPDSVDGTGAVALGDLNGDGALDLVRANEEQISRVHLNDGHGGFRAAILPGSGGDTTGVALGDLNGDGALDIVLGNKPQAQPPTPTPPQTSQEYLNTTAQTARLPNNPPTVTVTRPGPTANANFYSTPALFTGPTIDIPYALTDPEGDPVARVVASYSLDGGTSWRPATPAPGTQTANLVAAPAGTTHTFGWDIIADGDEVSSFFGQSDDVVFRIKAEPGRSGPNSVAGPFQHPYASAISFPFRVRGTQLRVLRNGEPVPGAIVYRLRPPSPDPNVDPRAQLLAGRHGQPWRTNALGYLAGRNLIALNDRLIALQPIGASSTYSLYFTSAAPNGTGLETTPISTFGVQTLNVSSANPLMLLNLSVALEWDARNDSVFLNRLQSDLQRVSALLYDVTDGQIALGQVTIYQNREHWYDTLDARGNLLVKAADIRIHRSNHLRPNATQGGIVTDDQVDPNNAKITYEFGHVRIGAVWNSDGDVVQKEGDDWARALAHELGHYALFLDDNYIGLDGSGRFAAISGCRGAMTDPYRDDWTEFQPPGAEWDTKCNDSLSARLTGRADWQTIKTFFDNLAPGFVLNAPPSFGANLGPSTLPLAVTQFTVVAAAGTAPLLDSRLVPLAQPDATPYTPSGSARAFLLSSDGTQLADLGQPFGSASQSQVTVRGAQMGDRLCVFDQGQASLGCAALAATIQPLTVAARPDWQPDVIVTPVTSRTLTLEVPADGVGAPAPSQLRARLFPADSTQAAINADLTLSGATYRATLNLSAPVLEGAVYVAVPNDASSPPRAIVSDYALGGNPAPPRRPRAKTRRRAPVTSTDGQVILYSDDLVFAPDEFFFFALQTATRLPAPPPGETIIGQGYRLLASDASRLTKMAINMAYAESAGAGKDVAVYFYSQDAQGELRWQRLPAPLLNAQNEVTAQVQGAGLYVLMARPWQSRLGLVRK